MFPSCRNACRLVAIVSLCLAICEPAWGYGWTGHWRVMEAAWPSLSAGVCDGQPNSHAFAPDAFDLNRRNIALAAGLGAIISDIGYVRKSTEQFSDLMHYIGTGNYLDDLVTTTCEKYGDDPAMVAFLAGMRSHYWADRIGHHEGTNVAVAMVSDSNRDKALTRVVYELDIPMHKRLELGAFSIYDLRYGGLRVAINFVAGGDALRGLVERVRYALVLAAEKTYGKAAAQFVPDYATMLIFVSQVVGSVCASASATYGTRPTPTDLRTLLDTCKKVADTPDVQKDPGVLKLAAEGYALARQPGLESIYEKSISEVTEVLRRPHKGPLPNYNLDTNLPSVGGQYHHADVAYRRLGTAADDHCDPAHPETIAGKAKRDWHAYQPAGLCVRQAVSVPMQTRSCSANPPSAATAFVEKYWLWDQARPLRPANTAMRTDSCHPAKLRWNRTTFQMNTQCVLSADPPARTLDLMLACTAARDGRTTLTPDDALDRLRLAPREYGPLDTATGLYR